jgi:hypothetical protein
MVIRGLMVPLQLSAKENDTMKQLILPVALATLTLVSACSSSKDDAKKAEASEAAQATATGEVAEEGGDAFTSNVAGVSFNAVAKLPKAPASASTQSECNGFVKAPQSPAARLVAKAGWGVTGEGRIGKYRAVSFAGSFEPSTSGSCYIGKGNVAIFDGETLVAIAYAPSSGKLTIANVLPFEEDSLRIWDGDAVPAPVADIRVVDGKGLVIQKLAAKELACGGGTPIPNIYGMPITKARKLLAKSGWETVGNGDAAGREDEREADLAAMGVTEVASCSGTGFAFCSYDYKRPEAALAVTTVGDNEDPSVAEYAVRCGG